MKTETTTPANENRLKRRKTDNPEMHRNAARLICKELYDRFVMGGWEPQDCHEYVQHFLEDLRMKNAIESYNERNHG